MRKRSLDAIIDENSHVIILGTMPSDESLRRKQYYANPRNQFWAILAVVYNEVVGHSYEDKTRFLVRKRLALWDVLQSAVREGSADRAIRHPVPNNFTKLFERFTKLRTLAFNGREAERLFLRLVNPELPAMIGQVKKIALPSSSPTAGKYVLSLDEKIGKWRALTTA